MSLAKTAPLGDDSDQSFAPPFPCFVCARLIAREGRRAWYRVRADPERFGGKRDTGPLDKEEVK